MKTLKTFLQESVSQDFIKFITKKVGFYKLPNGNYTVDLDLDEDLELIISSPTEFKLKSGNKISKSHSMEDYIGDEEEFIEVLNDM